MSHASSSESSARAAIVTPAGGAPSRPHPPRAFPPTDRRGTAWRTSDILRVVALTVGTVALLRGLWAASTVLLVAFLGVLFGLALTAGVDRLARAHVPRALGAALIVIGVFGSIGILGAALAPTLAEQGQEIEARLPIAFRDITRWINDREHAFQVFTGRHGAAPSGAPTGRAAAPSAPANPGNRANPALPPAGAPTTPDTARAGGGAAPTGGGVFDQLTQGAAGLSRVAFGFLGDTVEVVVSILLMLFLAIYVAADPELYHRGLMHLFPHRMRARAGDVLSAMATVLRKWLQTQVIAMATLGVVWAIALLLLGVRAAIALAVIAGLLEFIPTIGPTMAVIPALAMAALDSPAKALSVLGVYLAIQALESNVLIPMLMQGQIDLAPALTILAQALMTLAFGFLGLMVAVPVLAAVMVPIKLLYVEDVVGDEMETGEEPEPDTA